MGELPVAGRPATGLHLGLLPCSAPFWLQLFSQDFPPTGPDPVPGFHPSNL